ncbi:unnamed protein product [Echinostoma caproni]|uniref:Mucin-5AC-like n=1 Tax=Echinostoma caproni TaxID=27848 RepID=A0A183AEN2_9TREM|nr:unnamed protein product [Echinostoma caproni]
MGKDELCYIGNLQNKKRYDQLPYGRVISATNQFSSSSPIEVSADSDTTGPDATTKPTEAVTEPTTKPTDPTPAKPSPEQKNPPAIPSAPETAGAGQQSQPSGTGAQKNGQAEHGDQGEPPNERKAALSSVLLRKARDNSGTAGSNDVIVYYVLAFRASKIVAQTAQDCKEVNATNEVQKLVVLSNATGCQYRVKSESVKAVKVFVTATSGTKCVKVSSDGKSETLCPSGSTNHFTSSSPIDVSADSDTTGSDATSAPTTAATEAPGPTTKPKPEDDEDSKKTDPSGEHGKGVSSEKELGEKADREEAGSSSSDGGAGQSSGKDQRPAEKETSAANSAGDRVHLIRLAREASEIEGPDDVIVYYVLAQGPQSCKYVVASNEVQKVTVLGSDTGCQYRVKSDSGKAVKVYVNATSGTKCVKVSSEGTSETLGPLLATNQFSSSSPIEVSADSDTTNSEAPTATVPDAATERNTTPADSPYPKPPGDNEQSDQSRDPQKPPAGCQHNQASGTNVQPDEHVEVSMQYAFYHWLRIVKRLRLLRTKRALLSKALALAASTISIRITVKPQPQDTQSCKDVVASNEVQKVTVLGSGNGCQYRVKSDSGKAVKVYVNATSGAKCVKVSSDGKSETLCPSGVTNQFVSSSPIEVSANSDTTTSEATATEQTEVPPEPITQPTEQTGGKTSEDKSQKDPSSRLPDSESPAAVEEPRLPLKNDARQNVELGNNDKQPKVETAALSPALLRKVRAPSETNGPDDVIVYYVLDGVSTSNPPVLLIFELVALLINGSI